jgi:hypothetical protein
MSKGHIRWVILAAIRVRGQNLERLQIQKNPHYLIALADSFCRTVLLAVLLCLLAQSFLLPCAFASQKKRSVPMMTMPVVAPLFIESREISSSITIVNDQADTVTATVSLSDADGARICQKTMLLDGHSQQNLTVHDLLDSVGLAHARGSVTITAEGGVVAAQLSFTSSLKSSTRHFEEEFAMITTDGSPRSIAVASQVIGSPVLALKSLSRTGQTVKIQCISENQTLSSKSIYVESTRLVVMRACGDEEIGELTDEVLEIDRGENRGAVGVFVETTGKAQDLAVYGFSLTKRREEEVLLSMNFVDPALLKSANTIFTGVPVGVTPLLSNEEFVPTIALTNFSQLPGTAQIVLAKTDSQGTQAREITEAHIPPLTSQTISLDKLEASGDLRNSFVVKSNLPPGSIQAKMVSFGQRSFPVVEFQPKDKNQNENSGLHPWSADSSVTSTLLLFNHNDVSRFFNVNIRTASVSWQKAYKLQPLETMAIQINQLIQNQLPDDSGAFLPAGVSSGEVAWFTPGHAEGTGRLMQSSARHQLARNFSCGQCLELCGAHLSPFTTTIMPGGGTGQLGNVIPDLCMDPACACSGGFSRSGGSGFTYDWTSGNSAIASISGSSTSDIANYLGVAVGATFGDGIVISPDCSADAPGDITVTPKILLGGPNGTDITNTMQSVLVGQQIVLYASYTLPSGVTVSSQSWSVPGTPAGGYNHALTDGGPTALDFSQQSTTFYWDAPPATSQVVTFILHLSDNTFPQATATFNIGGPTAASVATQLGQVAINPGPYLQFGSIPSNVGIAFTASATPPSGYSNSFLWVQQNTNDVLTITLNDNTTHTCTFTTVPAGGDPFLDTLYPYDTGSTTDDSPRTVLDSTTSKELIRNFSAIMYLMWTPPEASWCQNGSACTIPVPLGSVHWQWSGDAVYNSVSQAWTLNSSTKSADPFQSSNAFPTWTRYSDYSSRTCN